MTRRPHRDAFGATLGVLAFLGGIALLLVVFRLAYDLFSIPPDRALNVQKGHTIDIGAVGTGAAGLVARILLLLVMGIVGSLIANRGVTMYAHSRHLAPPKDSTPEP